MPRGHMEVYKTKDFKGSLLRLFQNLDHWRYLLVIAVILAMMAAILSTIAPNKLADVTDVITEGIQPRTENIERITEEIMNHSYYSIEDQNDNIIHYSDFTLDGVLISKEDQIQFLEVLNMMDSSVVTDEGLSQLEQIPDSIKGFIEAKMDTNALKKRAIILGVLYLLNSIFAYAEGLIMAHVGIGYSKKLRKDISLKINRLPLRYFDSHETGDILSRVTNDVDTIGINMSDTITSVVTNATLFLGSIVMMFVTNWMMACTAIAASILGFIFSFLLLKRSQKYFVQRQKELGDLNGHIEEIYSGHNVVKAYNGEESALKEFDRINGNLYHCNRKSQFLSGIMQPIMIFIGNIGYVAVCVVGALLVMNQMISFGVIVAFMIYIRLFTNPLSRMAQAMTNLQSIVASAERVFEFMDEGELPNEDAITEKLLKEDVKGNVEFQHVKFGYDDTKTIIKDFSANIHSGEKIAIVGPTGAGKTTMVNLLMKFYDIQEGDILIDGKSVHDLKRENIHDLFVMVLQDTWLLDGTIKENIQYNRKNVSEEELWKVCEIVGIDHFIKTLPNGLNSLVTNNEAISSGQKQLLTIARGMMKEAPFLILDEATSNVDTRTEELVQKAMDKLMEGKTSFIIAHRLSTIKNADLILVMDDGNIVEQGKHDELIRKNGFYAKLYNSQFQK